MSRRSGVSKSTAAAIAAVIVVAIIAGCVSYYASTIPPRTVTVTTTATVTLTRTASAAVMTKTTTVVSKVTITLTRTVTSTSTVTKTKSTTSAAAAVTITDLAGRKVVLKHVARRVVVLESYWAEVITALGKANTIVGIGNWVKYDEYLPKAVRDKPAVGTLFKGVNVEEVAALKPDVVITDYGYGTAKELISKLQALGIPVVCMFIHNMNDELRAIKILGKILGAEDRANELISFIKSRWDLIKSKAASIPQSERLRVVMIDGYSLIHGGQILLYSNTSWGHSVVDVGAINLALQHFPNKDWPRISFETLLKWNPDAIVVTVFSPSSIQRVLDYIKSNVKWHVLKAYKDGRIYAVPCGSSVGGVLDWGPRDVIGREYLGAVLYPSVYKGVNWRGDMEYLLSHFYGTFIPAQAFASYSIKWMKVMDLSGHILTLPRKVTRVVDLLCYQLDLALGVMNRVVGISKFARFNPVLMKAYPNVTKIPSPGSSFSLNVEDVAALKPQLVILFPFMASNPSYVKQLRKLGINVLPVWLFSFKDIERLVWLLGTIYGVRGRAEQIVNDMNSIIKLVQSRVSGIPESQRVRVLYLWGKPTTVQGGHGTVNDFIRLAGGVNVAAKAFPNRDYVNVNLEQIVKWDPQIIVIWWWARYGPSKILKDPRWSAITAVRKGLVFKEPYYEHWGPDAAIFILWLAMKMYPQRFQGVSFTSIANKYFKEWYGIPYTAVMRGSTH